MKNIDNIVFSTGGVKGIVFIGCIKSLEENQLLNHVKTFAGSSIGALIAMMMCIGYTSDQMKELLYRVKIDSLREVKLMGIFDSYGICSMDKIATLIKYCLRSKGLSQLQTIE